MTPIYHVNVNPIKSYGKDSVPLGYVCIPTLNNWKPHYTMFEVLHNIYGIFYWPNPDSPYGLDKAKEFLDNRQLYNEKAKFFTEKYAGAESIGLEKIYNESWDFSYYKC